ncbi:MAG: hypothetical protein IPI53_01180 [Saprospiraceae bacterium]|nr:hypothetical protein [Saprospiraceae bacterium]
MKNFLFPAAFVTIFIFSGFSQNIVIDYNTLSILPVDKKIFKVQDFVSVVIRNYNDTIDDKFVVEITGEQYENTSGIDAFKKMTKMDTTETIVEEQPDDYYLLSLQVPDKDKSIIKITRYKPDGTTKIEERTYFFRNRGGLKFDVSSGFFISNLRDKIYVLKSLDTLNKQIVRENNGNIRSGIGLLAHLHCRSQKWLSGGLTGGFEINNDAKVGFLAGGSLFFGYDRKFVFSGGVAFSKVKTISDIYKVGDIVPYTINDIPTVEIWKSGWFGALTYNF